MALSFKDNFTIFRALLWRDVRIMLYFFKDNIIDSSIIVGFIYLVYAKLMTLNGMDPALLTPIFFGIVVIVLVNVAFDRLLREGVDIEVFHTIYFQLALPLSLPWLIAKYLVSITIDLLIATIPVVVLGILLFGSLLDLANGSVFLFIFPYLLSMTLLSTFVMVIVVSKSFGWIRDNMWPRILHPMTLLGALYYPWKTVYQASPLLGTLFLFNPSVYMVEGMRSALTGSALYISLPICVGVLTGLTAIGIFLVNKQFRKQFDPVQ